MDEAAERLYGLPLEEFTAARNAAAKELRPSDREAAERVKALRKPSQGAWALNQVARRAPDAVDRLLAAGEELRRVQEDVMSGAADRDALRAAVEAEREAVSALLDDAQRVLGRASAQTLERVRETLHAAAADGDVAEQLSAGRLVEEHQAVGLGGFGGAAPPARKPAARRTAKPAKKAKKPDKPSAKDKKAEREARKRVDAARKVAERARRELNAAELDRERAETAFRAADRAYQEARERCETAAGELESAHEELASALSKSAGGG